MWDKTTVYNTAGSVFGFCLSLIKSRRIFYTSFSWHLFRTPRSITTSTRMFNTSVLRTILILLSATRIIFSIPVPGIYWDELPSILASSEYYDAYSEEIISTSTITHTSLVPEDLTTELQVDLVCETADRYMECVEFLEAHLDRDSKEYRQLQFLKDPQALLPLPTRAAIQGYIELIQVLLRNGVPINKKYTSLEKTVLYVAAESEKNELISFLLTQGADIQVKDWLGNTPLHAAVSWLASTTVKLLLDAGADNNVTNQDGETPLFVAVDIFSPLEFIGEELNSEYITEYENIRYVNVENIIKLLLEHGADTNIANNRKITPLHVAAKNCNLTIVQLLIEGGANINATDENNQTPLHKATESNNVLVVEYLGTMGCNKTITDEKKKTALDIAKEKNFTKIVDLLSIES